jgi:hypothetical protein
MEANDWVIIAATLLGPVLAVQAQKAIERIRDRRDRKSWVFHALMATRADRLSAEHVQALNMVDLVFYGHRVLGFPRRRKSEQAVLDAWHEYLDHLATQADERSMELWKVRGDELFVNLLYAMAVDVGYKFDRVQLKKGAYSPVAHGDLELEQNVLRRLAIRVLSGEQALKMDVASFPANESGANAPVEVQGKVLEDFERRGSISVETKRDNQAI